MAANYSTVLKSETISSQSGHKVQEILEITGDISVAIRYKILRFAQRYVKTAFTEKRKETEKKNLSKSDRKEAAGVIRTMD